MKKTGVLIAAAAALSMTCACFAQDITVNLNGSVIDFGDSAPIISQGRTFVPLRGVFDKMGYDITWAADTKTVTLTKGSDILTIVIGKNEYHLNGVTKEMDVAAQIVNGRTMLPLRAIADATGAGVFWDGEKKLVAIAFESEHTVQNGQIEVSDENEKNFVMSFEDINVRFNETAAEYNEYQQKQNKDGIHSEEDVEEYKTALIKMRDGALKAKNEVAALPCPEKFKPLAGAYTDYMGSIADVTDYTLTHLYDTEKTEESEEQYNVLASALLENESKYNILIGQLFG